MKTIAFKSKLTLLVFGLAFLFMGASTPEEKGKVNWLTFEEAVKLNQENPKKMFIDLYTDWCGWCKRMDAQTFSHAVIADYLNSDFYPVKLNAEQKEEIVFQGHTFKFVPNGRRGYHELAASLLENKMSYPTFVILNEQHQRMQALPGFRNAKDLDQILKFFGEEKFQSQSWEAFQAEYVSPIEQ